MASSHCTSGTGLTLLILQCPLKTAHNNSSQTATLVALLGIETLNLKINSSSPPEDILNSDFHSDFEPDSTDESIPEDCRYMPDPCICLPPIDDPLPLGMVFLHKVKIEPCHGNAQKKERIYSRLPFNAHTDDFTTVTVKYGKT